MFRRATLSRPDSLSLLSPLAQLSTAHPLHSACSPNINSSRLCGIRNFPTVFSTRRSGDPSAVAPQTRAIIEKPSPLLSLIPSLTPLRRRSPRSFRPFHYETNQCFSLEKGSKRNSCSCTLSPSTLPLSSLSAVPYMRNRVSCQRRFAAPLKLHTIRRRLNGNNVSFLSFHGWSVNNHDLV